MRHCSARLRFSPAFESLETRRLFAVTAPALHTDFNGDGTIDSTDFAVMGSHWMKPGGSTTGDANGDGFVDTRDFNQLAAEFGKAAPPPTSGGTEVPPVAGDWNMVFNDEFDSATNPLDRGYVLKMWNNSGIGQEIDDAANVSVANGVLSLTATRAADGSIHSGQIQSGGNLALGGKTAPLFGFQYGYIEARINVPDGKGLWPAFWMMPVPNPTFHDGDGELDILDNGTGNPNSIAGGSYKQGVHFGHDNVGDLSGGWHTVGVDWQADHVTWYLDGQPIARMTDTNTASIPTVPMYFILGLQVNDGHTWGPAPDASTPFPSSMDVDYVRIWQQPA